MDFEDFVNENQKTWNKWTPTHINSKFYNNEEFKMTGNSLHSIELNALNNIKNKTLLHLQCHFGQDSISLAKKGANVTAVDFSSASINEAKKLSKLMGIKVNFILDNILNFEINQKFDLVFSNIRYWFNSYWYWCNFKKGYQLSNWRLYERQSRIDFK